MSLQIMLRQICKGCVRNHDITIVLGEIVLVKLHSECFSLSQKMSPGNYLREFTHDNGIPIHCKNYSHCDIRKVSRFGSCNFIEYTNAKQDVFSNTAVVYLLDT